MYRFWGGCTTTENGDLTQADQKTCHAPTWILGVFPDECGELPPNFAGRVHVGENHHTRRERYQGKMGLEGRWIRTSREGLKNRKRKNEMYIYI